MSSFIIQSKYQFIIQSKYQFIIVNQKNQQFPTFSFNIKS